MEHLIRQHKRFLEEMYLEAQEERKAALQLLARASQMREGCAISLEKLYRNSLKYLRDTSAP